MTHLPLKPESDMLHPLCDSCPRSLYAESLQVCEVWFPLSIKTWGDKMAAIRGQGGNGSQVQLFLSLTDFILPFQEWLIWVSILPFLLTVILHFPEIVCSMWR